MSRSRATTPSLDSSCRPKLNLLGGFSLSVAGDTVSVPMHSRRVLAYVSLYRSHDYSCDRSVLAERLWPEATTDHARASLRTALWRISGPAETRGPLSRSDRYHADRDRR